MTTNVVSPDMLSPLCARGRLAGRLSRILVCRCRFRVHNQTPAGDRSHFRGEGGGRVGHRGACENKTTPEPNPNQRTHALFVLFHPQRPMSGVKRSLRIFALPLSKQSVTNITGTGKGRAVLNTYYHFVTTSPSEADQGKQSLISKATDKATGIWADWGKAEPGTWKVLLVAPLAY